MPAKSGHCVEGFCRVAGQVSDWCLQVLITKAKLAAEEALRLLLFALNGLAALSVMDQELSSAICLYREVSFSSSEHHCENISLSQPISVLLPLDGAAETLDMHYLQQSSLILFPINREVSRGIQTAFASTQ